MKFSNILRLMKTEYVIEVLKTHINADNDVQKIQLFEEGIDEITDTLYIGTFKELPTETTGLTAIIGIESTNEITHLSSKTLQAFSSYALIYEDKILKTLQAINKFIHKDLQTSKEAADLMVLTMKGADLKTILKSAEKKLQNPIIVIDAGFKILDVSSDQGIDDPIWKRNIERGYCSYEFIKEVHNLEKICPFPDNSDVFEVVCKFSLYRKLCSKMFWKNQLVGYVIMLEKAEIKEHLYKEYLPFVGSSACEVLLRTEAHKGIFGSQKETLIYELIHGAEADLIHIRLKMNQMKFPDIMGCLVVKPNEYLNNIQATTFLKEQIEYILPGAFCLMDEENLVFICKMQQDGKLKLEEEKKLLALFQQGVVHMGISSPCTDIMALKDAYRQSKQLYNISTRMRIEKELMYFSSYNFYVMLSRLNEKELMQYAHPALKRLRDYDQAHNGELYRTLQTFIDCQSHMAKTSESLSIHRNSLSYRISKILDLTGIDLESRDEIFRLSYGFKVENYCRMVV